MDLILIITMIGVGVAGLAAVVGIWVERDRNRPPRWSYALSVLILLATFVAIVQSYLDAKENEKNQAKMQDDMARMLATLDRLAAQTDSPELKQFVTAELSAVSRANPEVVQKLAQRVADEGEDPAKVLGKHLSSSEIQGLARKGTLKTEKKKIETEPAAKAEPAAEEKKKEAVAPVRGLAAIGAPKPASGEPDAGAGKPAAAAGILPLAPVAAPGADTGPGGVKPAAAPLAGGLGGLGARGAAPAAGQSKEAAAPAPAALGGGLGGKAPSGGLSGGGGAASPAPTTKTSKTKKR